MIELIGQGLKIMFLGKSLAGINVGFDFISTLPYLPIFDFDVLITNLSLKLLHN